MRGGSGVSGAGYLFGREHECGVLSSFLTEAGEGQRGLVLEGPAGIGKTALWRAGCDLARQGGSTVLVATPGRVERNMSFSALTDLVKGIVANDPSAFARQPDHIGDAVLATARIQAKTAAPVDLLTVATGVREGLAHLSEHRPVLVAIDDVQWLDHASASVLMHTLRRLTGRVSVLLTRRVELDHEMTGAAGIDANADLRDLPEWVTRLVVPPLEMEAIAALVGERMPRGSASRAVSVAIAELSAGNPFIVHELIRANHDMYSGDSLRVPAVLWSDQAERVRLLSPTARDVVLACALAAEVTTLLLARASGFSADEVEQALLDSVDVGVIEVVGERVRFSHPLYASAIVAEADRGAQRRCHARLADHVTDVEQRARHLDASTVGVNDNVAKALLVAAQDLMHRGATSASEAMARRAIERATPASVDAALAAVIIGEVQFLRGDSAAEQTLAQAIEVLPTERSAPAHARLFRVILERDASRALPYIDRAIAVTEPGEGLVDLQIWKAHSLTFPLRWADAEAAAAAAHVGALAIGDEGLEAETIAVSVIVAMLAGRGFDEAKLAKALTLRDPARPVHPIAEPLFVAACCHSWCGQHDEAVKVSLALANHLDTRDQTVLDAFMLVPGVASACALGRLDVAEALMQQANLRGGENGALTFLVLGYLADAHLASYRGDAEATLLASDTVTTALRNAAIDLPQLVLITARPLALALNLAGRYSELDAHIGPLAGFAMAVDYPEPGIVAWISDWVDGLIELARFDEAAAALAWLGGRADAVGRVCVQGLVARGLGHLAAAQGRIDEAITLTKQSIELLANPPQPFEVARSQMQLGSLLRRKRSRRAAAECVEQAFRFFDHAGLTELAASAQVEIARLQRSRSGPDELTSAEYSTAELAASGLTNREIAGRLHVSEKTVEAHLGQAYRKLHIRRRIELWPPWAADGPSGPLLWQYPVSIHIGYCQIQERTTRQAVQSPAGKLLVQSLLVNTLPVPPLGLKSTRSTPVRTTSPLLLRWLLRTTTFDTVDSCPGGPGLSATRMPPAKGWPTIATLSA